MCFLIGEATLPPTQCRQRRADECIQIPNERIEQKIECVEGCFFDEEIDRDFYNKHKGRYLEERKRILEKIEGAYAQF